MFGWDGQAGLDHYLADPDMGPDLFLQEARWKENWGGSYNDYAPLIDFARSHHLPVLALNPPKPLVRRVAKEGLSSALKDPGMLRWQMRDEVLSDRSEEHTSELQSRLHLVCRLLLEKKKKKTR